jgi:hypothetical protein
MFIVLVEMRDEVWCRVMATLMMVVVPRGFALAVRQMDPIRTVTTANYGKSSNSGAS